VHAVLRIILLGPVIALQDQRNFAFCHVFRALLHGVIGAAILGAGGAEALPGFAGGAKTPGGDDEMDEKNLALRNACSKADVDEVVRLLRDGAEVTAREKSTGNQALHYAAQAGRTEICKRLVEAGAQIDQINLTGETPMACARGHAETEEYLTSLGARTDTGDAAASTQDYV